MNYKCLAGIILASVAFTSCDETTNDIGIGLIDNMDHLQVNTDTFTVSTRSIIADSVLSRNTIGYLGKIRDPETGAYITGDYMVQFYSPENYYFPKADSIASKDNGMIIADSCEIRLYRSDFYGDSLTPMRLTAYEMDHPMTEDRNYYSNFDPIANGYIRDNGVKVSRTYSISDLNVSDSVRKSSGYTSNIRILLNDPYTAKDGTVYNNYGSYIMNMYYKDPDNFKNALTFINQVVPGFYIKNQSGLGSMIYIGISQLNIYFRYISNGKTVTGTSSFPGTEEVLQTTTITNDSKTIQQLAADQTCTYLKTPAGLFTEMTLPVDEILKDHQHDSINTAKVVLTCINNSTSSGYALKVPQNLLMIPKSQLYSFFENGKIADYKTSFLASYASDNTYTFNNISGLITYMKGLDRSTPDWNKVVIIPVTLSTYTTSNNQTILTRVVHDMSLTSTKLVGGSQNPYQPIKISVIYSKFE